jgi:hypothetical protein
MVLKWVCYIVVDLLADVILDLLLTRILESSRALFWHQHLARCTGTMMTERRKP